jgi:hypothetical protein
MIEAGQANAAQNHAGMNPCPGGTGAQGIMAGAANAVSLGSHPLAPQGMPTKPALAGISDGAKKSIAVINTVLTTLRVFIGSPRQQAKPPMTFLPQLKQIRSICELLTPIRNFAHAALACRGLATKLGVKVSTHSCEHAARF